ncbi:MAG: hypothetical protein HY591_04145 [Candidatus Omnitrophica bacterium]|nr:hypothetical protein [Candidatus Omnitrophota bacterium]
MLGLHTFCFAATEEQVEGAELGPDAIFDDRALINGYTDKYADESKDVLWAMINDDSLGDYKMAAAIRVFKQKYGEEILKDEKPGIIKTLIRRLNHSGSAFVQVEIMHTLVVLDRYQYFASMVPPLLQKMDHYNRVVSALAYDNLQETIKNSIRTREARIVFNTLRKILFLSRKRLGNIQEPDQKLRQKLTILRWAVKVLGTQELKNLPQEVIGLL